MAQDDWQEYLDELFLLARRVDERSHQLTELAKQQQMASEQLTQCSDAHQTWSEHKLSGLSSAVEAAKQHSITAQRYLVRTAWVFVATIWLAVLVVLGSLWWIYHLHASLAETQAQLAALQFKLKHTPTYVPVKDDGTYIRVVPEKVGSLSRQGQDLAGTYAKVWYPS